MMIFHNSTLLGICQSRCAYLYGTGEAPFASCTLRHCLDRNEWRQIYNVHFASRQNFKGSMFVPPMYSGIYCHSTIVRDTSALFSQYPARITVTRLAPDLTGFNPRDYSIRIEGTASSAQSDSIHDTGREGLTARFLKPRTDNYNPLI
jgi:hypothetical protein